MDELIDSMMLAFNDFDAKTLNFRLNTLMSCLDDVITCHGDNDLLSYIWLGKEKRLNNANTLPNFLIPIDESLEVYDMMEGAA
jgi:hypothetical protein